MDWLICAMRCGARFEEQVHQFLQHAAPSAGRHVAQLGNGGLVQQVVGRAGLGARQEGGVGFAGLQRAPAFEGGLQFADADGLGDVVVHAGLQAFFAVAHAARCRSWR